MDSTAEVAVFNLGFNQEKRCSLKSAEVNDILISGNIIILFGKCIEAFTLQQNENVLQKTWELQENLGNLSDFSCVKVVRKQIMCGHSSGFISFWTPGSIPLLTKNTESKLHQGKVNKISVKIVNEQTTYIMTCGDDMVLKLLNFEKNMEEVTSLKFNFGVVERFEAFDIGAENDAKSKDNFFVILANGEVVVLNEAFREIFKIKESQSRRLITSVKNPQNFGEKPNSSYGDFIVLTRGNSFEIYVWIPEFKTENSHQHHFTSHTNYPHGGRGRGRGGYYAGH